MEERGKPAANELLDINWYIFGRGPTGGSGVPCNDVRVNVETVSATVLMMEQDASAAQAPVGEVGYEERLDHYQQVDERINAIGCDNGQHAYFHHLGALLGYQPRVIRSSTLRSF